jgi:hypothetical protein
MIASRGAVFGASSVRLSAASPLARALTPYMLLVAVGVELALLTAFLPGTVDRFLHGPSADFHNLWQPAHARELPGLYNPFLVVLFFPLGLLPEMAAFRVFMIVNAACVLGVALIAQRGVRSFEARTVIALAPLALPQMHWALRLGHLTPLVALLALIALLLLRTHPRRGAILIAVMSLKPQYVIAPIAYLVWRREIRLLAIVFGATAALAVLGFAVIGPSSVRQFAAFYLDWGPNSTDNLLPVQQSWMVSWTGFQISLGREANPLITIDLILLSLGVACFAWARSDTSRSIAVVALMFIPLTPYAQFYDGALVIVAIALLLRTDLADVMKGILCGALYLAAITTQTSINFPAKDVLGPAHTYGVYWLTPALVGVAALIAVLGRRVPRGEVPSS